MLDQHSTNSDIVVDYYQGANGSTIRVAVSSMLSVARVKETFLERARSQVAEIDFCKIAHVKTTNIKALVLKRVADGKEGMQMLECVNMTAEGPVFMWSRDSEGWLECAELLDPFLANEKPGHQYLTREYDDAIIEFAFRETP